MTNIKYIRPLAIAIAAETKRGKSTIGAMICKKYGGVLCDFSRINQGGGMDGTPVTYQNILANNAITTEADGTIVKKVGEAFTACNKQGLDIEKHYRLILKWKDFEDAIQYAQMLSTIQKKKMWLVLDDMTAVRWHKTLDVSERLGHKSNTQKDWIIAAGELKLMISALSDKFNLLLINQMIDEYAQTIDESEAGKKTKNKEKSGVRVPDWIPRGADYLVDGMLRIEIDKSSFPYKQYLVIEGGREVWICADDFVPRVDRVTPDDIFKALGITEDRL